MLRELRIRNFVLIEELHIEFDGGFNCLTGETGAGKSIIVDALGLLLGDRVRGDLIRPGAEEASVEAVFHGFDSRREKQLKRCLGEFGLEADPEGLFIKRLIRRDGKGRCYVNSSPTQLKILETLGDLLVDIHGQHDHQSLLHGEIYIDLLDAYGGVEQEAEEVTRQFGDIQRLQGEIDRLMETHRERMRQEDHLKFQIQEIEQAEIVPEEETILEQDRHRLQHSEHLAEHAAFIQATLHEGHEESQPVVDRLAEAQRRLQEMAEVDPTLASLERDLATALIQIQEVGREVSQYASKIEHDPERLLQIEDRLHLLKGLKNKYGATLEEVLQFLEQSQARLTEMEGIEGSLEKYHVEIQQVTRQFVEKAIALSHKRQKAAVRLSRSVTRELKDLGMEHGQFMVQVDALGETGNVLQIDVKNYRANSHGIDRVEFLIRTNPGQDPAPLKQIASGGEISRIALAIKTVLARVDRVGCLIFDEIDAGIGGNIAEVIGTKFRKVAEDRQIVCVTHLPQIAGKAHRNFRVTKTVSGQETLSRVEKLEGEERITEIARMLGNDKSEDSRAFARRLLAE